MSADGVNGKQNITKIGANPFLSIHPIAFRTLSCLFTNERNDCDKMADDEKTSNAPITDQAMNKETGPKAKCNSIRQYKYDKR